MAEKITTWIEKVKKKVNINDLDYLSNYYFFRDPARPQFINRRYFFAPADGTILYAKEVDSDEKILDIKGLNYNIKNLLYDEGFNRRCLVVGIFMSFYDVHINRMPTSGILTYEDLPSIKSYNYPMLFTEKEVLGRKLKYKKMGYALNNERRINWVYSPELDYEYYMVQIADDDINVIMHFELDQEESFTQNQRFSFIRWGSQCELILPLDERYEFKPLLTPEYHVEAGIDKLIKINRKKY